MGTTSAGVRFWDGSESADIAAATNALANSINSKVVGVFADTAGRDAAYASLTSAQKAGIIAYIQNRQGHSYWSPQDNAWKWVSINRVLANDDQIGSADVHFGDGFILAQAMTPVTLPPGNRLIRVDYSCIATSIDPLGAATNPRVSVTGTGMGTTASLNTYITGYIPATTVIKFGVSLSRSWQYVLSGTVDIKVYAAQPWDNGSTYNRFNNGRLDVIDMGPV